MRDAMMRISRKKFSLLIVLVCFLTFYPFENIAAGETTLDTHQTLTALVSSRTKWLLTAPAEKGSSKPNATLLAFTMDGDFHPITFKKTGGVFRANVQDYPTPSDLAASVPPTQLPDGSFVGAGKSGMFINVDTIERRWSFVWPSIRPSILSKPAVLDRGNVAMVGVDGSILLFQKKEDKWLQTQVIKAKTARVLPDAVLTTADLDGNGRKELIVPAVPSKLYRHAVLGDDIEPTEIHAYRFNQNSLELMDTYTAGKNSVFETIGTLVSDLDKDGKHEILVTKSDFDSGAAHLVLGMRNKKLMLKARSDAIGTGNRWSHLLGAFNIDGSAPKILAVETPHLSGLLLALRLSGNRLRERARMAGFTTHSVGSRNLWKFALLRRRGVVEAVMQEIGQQYLSGLALFGNRWHFRWSRPIPSPVRSNLLTADFNQDAKDDIAFVDQAGLVHIYLSK